MTSNTKLNEIDISNTKIEKQPSSIQIPVPSQSGGNINVFH